MHRLCSLSVLFVLIFVASPSATSSMVAAATANAGRIAFVSSRDGNPEIYVMNADGSGATRLTNDPADDRSPAWSPDGKHIAFASGHDLNTAIYVMNADGSGRTKLTQNGQDADHPSWSPNGSRIAYDVRNNYGIYVMNADGSDAKQIGNLTGHSPSWSPDGTRIAFSASVADPLPSPTLYVANIDGSGQTEIGGGSDPVWSPDGKYIAATSCCATDPAGDLYVMNSDGTGSKQLTHTDNGNAVQPTWSPDGKRIAFAGNDFDDNTSKIYLIHPDGTGLTALVDGRDPDWSRAAAPTSTPAPTTSEPRCFPETGQCIAGRIREFWEQNGGLPVFGLPITPQQTETIEGASLQVQWFERNRLELHPENARPYDVLLGRLGVDRLQQESRDWQSFAKSTRAAGCRFFPETGHNVCAPILAAWRASGLEIDGRAGKTEAENLALFGLPLSDAQTETLSDGKQYTVQWFERGRFELHPENAPPYNILLGLLGKEVRAAGQPGS